MKKGRDIYQRGTGWRGAVWLLLSGLVLAGGCADQEVKKYVTVNIDVDAQGCPARADPELVTVSRSAGESVRWVARESAAAEKGKPASSDREFTVYFDPFMGGADNRSSKNGVLKSRPLSTKIPVGVKYKYTIVTDACPDRPLDPGIDVRN